VDCYLVLAELNPDRHDFSSRLARGATWPIHAFHAWCMLRQMFYVVRRN